MFCPRCAAQNIDGSSFCRSCGANLKLIPQALAGQLPVADAEEELDDWASRRARRRREHKEDCTIDSAVRHAFTGLAFLIVAIALAFTRIGNNWWFFMLIPAFSMLATGISQYVRIKDREKRALQSNIPSVQFQPAPTPPSLRAPQTGQLMNPPASVTEGTTRHLGAEAATRHFGSKDAAR